MNFNEIYTSIQNDIDEGTPVQIINETSTSITVMDETEMYREYTIWDPASIDTPWIASRIIETPYAASLPYRVDISALANWMSRNIAPEFMETLEAVVIMGDYDEDYNFLRGIGDFGKQLEQSELPLDEQMGLHWYSFNKVFINMGCICNEISEWARSGEIEEWDEAMNVSMAVTSTAAHEVRHLAQANPYLPDSILQQRSDDESDAENYGRMLCECDRSYVVYANN